ncbi:hypothetical protein J3F83DRAFT_193377 [Trichoderma novae-zelandiae]
MEYGAPIPCTSYVRVDISPDTPCRTGSLQNGRVYLSGVMKGEGGLTMLLSCFWPSLSAIYDPLTTPRMEGFDKISRHVWGARGSGDGAPLWLGVGNSPAQSCWTIQSLRRLFFPRGVPEARDEATGDGASPNIRFFAPLSRTWPLRGEKGEHTLSQFRSESRGDRGGKLCEWLTATLSTALPVPRPTNHLAKQVLFERNFPRLQLTQLAQLTLCPVRCHLREQASSAPQSTPWHLQRLGGFISIKAREQHEIWSGHCQLISDLLERPPLSRALTMGAPPYVSLAHWRDATPGDD